MISLGDILFFIFCANCWVPYRVDPAHMHCQSSFMSLFQKSSMQVFFIYWEVTKAWKVWLLLMRSVPKSAAIFLGQWLGRVRHAETDKKEKKENKGHSALWAELKPRAFLGHWLWVPERAKTQKRESFSWRCSPKNREKHSDSVREWKRKRDFFLCSSYTQGR